MSLVKKIARKIILPLALNIGLAEYYKIKNKKNCCIINFHGVRSDGSITINNRHIPLSEFEKLIKHLSKNYTIVPLTELFELHKSGKKTLKKTIALTFDDGYENNFKLALPILKKYNAPATYYIISKCLVDAGFIVWPDLLDISAKFNSKDFNLNGQLFPHPHYINVGLNLSLIEYLKKQGDKSEILAQSLVNNKDTLTALKEIPELCKLITPEDFKTYSKEPLIEFGSHTHTHYCLEYLDKEVAKQELKKSKELIEEFTGRPVVSIAFPDGSYTNQTLEICKELGYENAVAVSYKFNENNNNPFLLSRFTISNSTTFESNAIRLAKQFDTYGF